MSETITDIKEIRILPPMGIARFGSSPEPMQNYVLDVFRDEYGKPTVAKDEDDNPTRTYRQLIAAESLVVNADDGTVSLQRVEEVETINFRDADGRIKPVCPFFEVWAVFEDDGPLLRLTSLHLSELGLSASDVKWRVVAANSKAFRRTGDENDNVVAVVDQFSDHDTKTLMGECQNFKPGKNIKFGTIRYIRPNDSHPQIRARFTPAMGKVFGPNQVDRHVETGEPLTNDDVYAGHRAARHDTAQSPATEYPGKWDRYWYNKPDTPPFTAPADIFQGEDVGNTKLSHGYFDDTCDGILEVSISLPEKTISSYARFSSAVPDFAPDCLPVRSISDDVEQMVMGTIVDTPIDDDGKKSALNDVQDILRRGVETVQQMNTMVQNGDEPIAGIPQNRNNMPGQVTGTGRIYEPTFGQGGAEYSSVVQAHGFALRAALQAADLEDAFPMMGIVRMPEQIADLSNDSRRLMPSMMRGNEGLELCLTMRQINKLGLADSTFTQETDEPQEDNVVEHEGQPGALPVAASIVPGADEPQENDVAVHNVEPGATSAKAGVRIEKMKIDPAPGWRNTPRSPENNSTERATVPSNLKIKD